MPKIEQKQVIVEEIKKNLEGAKSVVLIDSRGLGAGEDTELRKNLREARVFYKVYKNTMLKLAFKGSEFENLSEFLSGPSAVAISYDEPTSAARIISKQAKDNEHIEFKAGVLEGVLYDSKAIVSIANIPPREELLSKLLGSFKSPMASFARVIKAIAEKQEA